MANPQKIKAKLKHIQSHGSGVYSLFFSVPKKYTRFKPGQFTHLTLEDFDSTLGFWPESRVFSIASEPKTEELRIVYSVKGLYTSRMENELAVNNEYWLKFPYGSFTIEDSIGDDQNIVLIAGGTGISPFIPYLLDKVKKQPDRIVKLYYGVQKVEYLLFKDEMDQASALLPNFTAHVYTEEQCDLNDVCIGRLDIDRIYSESNELNSPAFFLSGPPQMISIFKNKLIAYGVQTGDIHIDEWE